MGIYSKKIEQNLVSAAKNGYDRFMRRYEFTSEKFDRGFLKRYEPAIQLLWLRLKSIQG